MNGCNLYHAHMLRFLVLPIILLQGLHGLQKLNDRTDVPAVVALSEYTNDILDSGGALLSEQAAINVHYYDLDLTIDPDNQSISGNVQMQAHVEKNIEQYVAHLDTVFNVEKVYYHSTVGEPGLSVPFEHKKGLIVVPLQRTFKAGESLHISVIYSGRPRVAPNPPWEGGFTWEQTTDGQHWVGVSCQVNGADIWWPAKDHPSDRPDSVSIRITVPESLTAVSNGVLRSIEQRTRDSRTFHWVTRHPISNYAVSVNIGPYVELREDYTSITGEVFPIYFWALPENSEKARQLMVQVKDQMLFFEQFLGPYPYRHEKYGVVETPFFGMEHQTIIAYGAGYTNDTVFETDSGFDDLHHHELSHEWWGNYVTAFDWRDFWIHEGFGTYMQPLYAEHLRGKDQYLFFMERLYERIQNNMPIGPRKARTTREMFKGRDIYMKGAWILHTLRNLIGDEAFFASLAGFIYPEILEVKSGDFSAGQHDHKKEPLPVSQFHQLSDAAFMRDNSSARFVDTWEYVEIVEALIGKELSWFFDAYLLQSALPVLEEKWDENGLILSWKLVSGDDFPMPVEVFDGRKLRTVIPDGKTAILLEDPDLVVIDPDNKVLRDQMYRDDTKAGASRIMP